MSVETQANRQARQRASVKWLLSKAFNHFVPDNLKEPFYRDHENQERLKPQIIVELGNAVLYCQTLSNLYTDPNYHNLNHWSIIQMLGRKGFPVTDVTDIAVTETVLVQTNPLKINAHVSVIESMMLLYAKEVLSGDRLTSAIRKRFDSTYHMTSNQTIEQSLLAWITYVCNAKQKQITSEILEAKEKNNIMLQTPIIPKVSEIQSLSDGVCIALLISYFCPKAIPWTSVRIKTTKEQDDSIHNMILVSNFAQFHLPYNVYHMRPEDVPFMAGSMKLNLIMLLVDLFILFEINPAKCVGDKSTAVQDDFVNAYNEHFDSQAKEQSNKENFVVTKTRAIPTLSSMKPQKEQPLHPAHLRQSKEKSFIETKDEEKGRRSRRNSSSEDSQLTIENFGGSQDHLYSFGYSDRQSDIDRQRNLSFGSIEPVVALRSSVMDVRGTLQLGYDTDSGSEKQDRDTEKCFSTRQENIFKSNKAVINPINYNTVSNTNKTGPISKNYYTSRPEYFSDNLFDSKTNFYENENGAMVSKFNKWHSNNDYYNADTKSLDNAPGVHMQQQDKLRYLKQERIKYDNAALHYREKEMIVDSRQPHMNNYHHLTMQPMQPYNYGSTPHLPQMFNASEETMNSRPVNYERYQQNQQQLLPFKSIDEESKYILSQKPPSPNHQTQYTHSRNPYIGSEVPPYVQNCSEPQHPSQIVHNQLNIQNVASNDYAQFHNAQDISLQPNTFNSYPASPPFPRYTWRQPSFEQFQQNWESQNNLCVDYKYWDTRPSHFTSKANYHQGFVMPENGSGDQHMYQLHLSAQKSHSSNSAGHQPSDEIMTPQSICFIGDEGDVEEIERNIIDTMQGTHISDNVKPYCNEIPFQNLKINSGNLTFRIPLQSRPNLQPNSFQDPQEPNKVEQKGFYISLAEKDFEHAKRPSMSKSSKKDVNCREKFDHFSSVDPNSHKNAESENSEKNAGSYDTTDLKSFIVQSRTSLAEKNLGHKNYAQYKYNDGSDEQHQKVDNDTYNKYDQRKPEIYGSSPNLQAHQLNGHETSSNDIIGTEETNIDPKSFEEMERRKEKIWLLSLQRRQQQEEAKSRKELEAAQKRDRDRYKEEERARKKNEQSARRAIILEQHRLKKAIEEAEREGKTFDAGDLPITQQFKNSPAPRLRSQNKITRPRPNTIHVDDRSIMSETSNISNISSRDNKGSSGNLTESPDEYASTRSTPTTRRGSFKTHRAGPRLYKQPTAKSNRGIVLNAVEYCVFPGAVNHEAKQKVLEKIGRSDAKHFLILFRDAGCQFRALYGYSPETNQVCKLYGTGPSQVDEVMFDKYFKYNSGGKCFSQIHTKHLTVTIDAFTIHNSLWQGKKMNLANKKNMSLVI